MAIRGPKGSHPTVRGWIDPRTGELLKSQKIPESFIADFFGDGSAAAPPPPPPEPVSHVMSDDKLEMYVNDEGCDCEDCNCDPCTCKMNKRELEEYGRTVGIELDRRKTKAGMLEDLEAFKNA
jgi:hypothetical protein